MNPYIQYMYSYPHKTAYRPMEGVDLKDWVRHLGGPGHGLYLHVPFCQGKCGFCNLFSVTGAGKEETEAYLDAVERQLGQYSQCLDPVGASFSSFTIGGGTPLLLTVRQLDRVFSMTGRYLKMEEGRDTVIETAPNQTEREKLKLLKAAGVTRVSMGVQSFHERELKTLKRGHSAGRAREALKLLMSFDFPCVNIDLIYGIPGQRVETLLESVREAVEFGPREIFLYPLYVKHGVRLEQEGTVPEPELAYAQYKEASSFLRSEGFYQDSMRRFVRRETRQKNRGFSDCGFSSSLALGCGGRSYLGNLHFCTPYAVTREGCLKELRTFAATEDFARITHGIRLSEDEVKRRYVIRHLLIRPGVEKEVYRQKFGGDLLEDFPLVLQWIREGLASEGEVGYVALTDRGIGLSDYLGPMLISRDVQKKMDQWEEAHGLGRTHGSLQGSLKKL